MLSSFFMVMSSSNGKRWSRAIQNPRICAFPGSVLLGRGIMTVHSTLHDYSMHLVWLLSALCMPVHSILYDYSVHCICLFIAPCMTTQCIVYACCILCKCYCILLRLADQALWRVFSPFWHNPGWKSPKTTLHLASFWIVLYHSTENQCVS